MPDRSYEVEILNAIRNDASASYIERIPAATISNIAEVGNAILEYEPVLNEFTQVLIGKIGKTIISSKMAKNPLAPFKRGELAYGTDVEDIFVEMAEAEGAFDPTGSDPLSRRLPEVLAMYHRENRQDAYAVSTSEDQIKGAFTRAGGVTDLVNKIVNSIYSGDMYDEFVLMKELLAGYSEKYYDYEVTAITDDATAKQFIRTVRKAVADLRFMTDKYNAAEVKQYSNPEDLVLIINKDVIAHVDVDVLADVFNLGKTDFEPQIVVVDDFGTMSDTYGLLVDKDFFAVWDTNFKHATQENAQGLFTNHFLHHWQIHSLCEFQNAVRFTTDLREAEEE